MSMKILKDESTYFLAIPFLAKTLHSHPFLDQLHEFTSFDEFNGRFRDRVH